MTQATKLYPIGIQTFEKIRNGNYLYIDKTEIIYEPWHWRYVGAENAAKINASGLCFEEYIETLQSIAAEG